MPPIFKTLILALLITFSFLAVSKVVNAEDTFSKDDFFENSKYFEDEQTFNAYAEQRPVEFIASYAIINTLILTMHENCRFLKANDFFNISDPKRLPKNGDFGDFVDENSRISMERSEVFNLFYRLSRKDILEIEGYAPRLAKLYPCKK